MARKPNIERLRILLLTTAATHAEGNLLPAPIKIARQDISVREAIGTLVESGLADEITVDDPKLSWRIDDDKMFGAVINDAGREAVAGAITSVTPKTEPVTGPRPCSKPEDVAPEPAAKLGSNTANAIDLLKREQGASMTEITKATGWLPHSGRAAISGLRKKQMVITCTKADSGSIYRIVSSK